VHAVDSCKVASASQIIVLKGSVNATAVKKGKLNVMSSLSGS
jgi:hypothetical protein